ncbi:MAG: flagellar motor switch protein FliN [Firmicutes bacterium]|nr:flagellar motor switch protein FliN [Bacillota bacterium]
MMNEQEIKEFFKGMDDRELVVNKVKFPQLEPADPNASRMKIGINYLDGVPVTIRAELGSTIIRVRDLLNLEEGSVLTLDRPAGESVDLYLNQQSFGHGEVVILGNNLGLRIHSISAPNANGDNENG